MAPRTVQNLMTVNKLPEALKEAVTENQVPVNAAVKLAQLPEEQQKEIEEAITTQQLDLTAENLDAYKETGDISELKRVRSKCKMIANLLPKTLRMRKIRL